MDKYYDERMYSTCHPALLRINCYSARFFLRFSSNVSKYNHDAVENGGLGLLSRRKRIIMTCAHCKLKKVKVCQSSQNIVLILRLLHADLIYCDRFRVQRVSRRSKI